MSSIEDLMDANNFNFRLMATVPALMVAVTVYLGARNLRSKIFGIKSRKETYSVLRAMLLDLERVLSRYSALVDQRRNRTPRISSFGSTLDPRKGTVSFDEAVEGEESANPTSTNGSKDNSSTEAVLESAFAGTTTEEPYFSKLMGNVLMQSTAFLDSTSADGATDAGGCLCTDTESGLLLALAWRFRRLLSKTAASSSRRLQRDDALALHADMDELCHGGLDPARQLALVKRVTLSYHFLAISAPSHGESAYPYTFLR
jgi:hypothetical protein